MKVDDDIVLNVPRLYSILQSNTSPKFTLGKVNRVHPIRTTTGGLGKWYTPEWVYPEEWYPPYLNGHAYVLSTDVAEMTYHAALETKLLPWSDVFVGECMQKLKIKLTHGKNFLTFQLHKMNFDNTTKSTGTIMEYLTAFHLPMAKKNKIWAIWTHKDS